MTFGRTVRFTESGELLQELRVAGLLVFLMFAIGGAAALAFYFLPSIVAFQSKHGNAVGVFLVNFLLGWSLIGWIAALIWAFSKPQPVVIVQAPYPYPPSYGQVPPLYSHPVNPAVPAMNGAGLQTSGSHQPVEPEIMPRPAD